MGPGRHKFYKSSALLRPIFICVKVLKCLSPFNAQCCQEGGSNPDTELWCETKLKYKRDFWPTVRNLVQLQGMVLSSDIIDYVKYSAIVVLHIHNLLKTPVAGKKLYKKQKLKNKLN